jgi:phosphoribosyl-AMP cyclohydrolase / phosphoribosyl-ATP pyrophosphohydrolase
MTEALIHNLVFDDRGLITAIVQDNSTNEVLMAAYMNAESLAKTLQTGETWFWSRSRQELWHKGATSGNIQKVMDIRLDCDGDALLVRVDPKGPACHTGERTCFFQTAGATGGDKERSHTSNTAQVGNEEGRQAAGAPEKPESLIEQAQSAVSLVNVAAMDLGILLQDLYNLIQERQDQRPEGSYTTYLFNSGLDKILKKVGEESAETIIAAKNTDLEEGRKQLSAEISDLLYHLLVLMVERDVSLQDILNELNDRTGKKK